MVDIVIRKIKELKEDREQLLKCSVDDVEALYMLARTNGAIVVLNDVLVEYMDKKTTDKEGYSERL